MASRGSCANQTPGLRCRPFPTHRPIYPLLPSRDGREFIDSGGFGRDRPKPLSPRDHNYFIERNDKEILGFTPNFHSSYPGPEPPPSTPFVLGHTDKDAADLFFEKFYRLSGISQVSRDFRKWKKKNLKYFLLCKVSSMNGSPLIQRITDSSFRLQSRLYHLYLTFTYRMLLDIIFQG